MCWSSITRRRSLQLTKIAVSLPVEPAETTRRVGRGAEIRTPDLLVPNQALYQAEPRPEWKFAAGHKTGAITSIAPEPYYCCFAAAAGDSSLRVRITWLRVS